VRANKWRTHVEGSFVLWLTLRQAADVPIYLAPWLAQLFDTLFCSPNRKEERLLSSCHSLLGCRGIYCNPWHTLEFLKTVRHAYIELPFASTQIRFNLTEVWVLILCFLLYYQQNQKAINTEFLYLIRLWKSLRKCFIIKYKSQSNTT